MRFATDGDDWPTLHSDSINQDRLSWQAPSKSGPHVGMLTNEDLMVDGILVTPRELKKQRVI